jgi:hypothetical protein
MIEVLVIAGLAALVALRVAASRRAALRRARSRAEAALDRCRRRARAALAGLVTVRRST